MSDVIIAGLLMAGLVGLPIAVASFRNRESKSFGLDEQKSSPIFV